VQLVGGSVTGDFNPEDQKQISTLEKEIFYYILKEWPRPEWKNFYKSFDTDVVERWRGVYSALRVNPTFIYSLPAENKRSLRAQYLYRPGRSEIKISWFHRNMEDGGLTPVVNQPALKLAANAAEVSAFMELCEQVVEAEW
jgi:hypothetical protein